MTTKRASKTKAKPEVFQSMVTGPGVSLASDAEVRRIVPIDTVLQDPRNARERTPRNLAAIKAALKQFGQQKPIVVDADGIIRAGNGTHLAAKALGWRQIWITSTQLTGEMVKAYAVADNRTTDLSQFDEEMLLATMTELSPEARAATGYDQAELDELMPSAIAAGGAKGDDSRKALGHSDGRINVRVLLALTSVAEFELALTRTHIPNREKALQAVVAFFLDNHPEGS